MTDRVGVEEAETGPRLSACLLTAGPGPRVAALLGLLRPVADELVVALDDRADAETEAMVSGAADAVVRYCYREPVDRPLRWLFSLCAGDWILNLDDDEVPSAALLGALPALLGARDVTHYWLLRRWLWPEPGLAIAEHPWSADYQLRLVLNDPRLLRFPSETHRPLEALGAHRFVREGLYHLDALLNSLESREAKARRYERLRPGLRIAGGPLNHVFHLPERRPGLRTEPVPLADLELVRAVLAAAPSAGMAVPPAARVETASDEEIEQTWAGRGLGGGGYRARLTFLDAPTRLLESEQRTFDVRVESFGSTVWPAGERGEPEVRLSYRWLDTAGEVVAEGVRTALPADLSPGDQQVVPLHVLAPPAPGRLRLHVDLVHEHVRWFGCGVEHEAEIAGRLRVALLGEEEAVARLLAELPDRAPEFEPVVLAPGPGPRFGPPRVPDLRSYLLAGTGERRTRDLWLLASRSTLLLRAAERMSREEPARPLLDGAQEVLETLRSSTHLLLVAGTSRFGTRELWLQAATVAVAHALAVEVVVQEGALARPESGLDRTLVRSVHRMARLVGPGELGLG